jgi:tetratricopeptide (TPR) repeat protein
VGEEVVTPLGICGQGAAAEERPPRSPGSRDRILVVAIAVAAFVVRLFYLIEMRSSPTFDSPLLDPLYHDRWASRLAAGDWLGGEVFFRAPLYPYFLGLIYRIAGHSYLIPRVVQAGVGALSCGILAAIGCRLFGRRIGLGAAGAAALYGLFIYFEGELLIVPLFIFLCLASLWSLLLVEQRPSRGRWLLSGMLLGLAAIARPNILLFACLLPFWAFVVVRRRVGAVGALRGIALITLGMTIVVAPVAVRNWVVGRDFVPIASQGGINFYLGNNPWADGMSAIMPGVGNDWDEVAIAEKEVGKELSPSEVSRYWWGKGLSFVRSSPGRFLILIAKKAGLFWNGVEVSNNQNIYFFRRYSRLLSGLVWRKGISFPFGIVSPLALIGMALSVRRWRRYLLLYTFVFAYGASVILFFVSSRHRLPAVPVLLLFAAAAFWWLVEELRRRRWRSAGPYLVSLLLLMVAANFPVAGAGVGDFAQSHYNMANALLRKGEWQRAEEAYRACLEIDPRFPLAHLNLGVAYYRQGNLGQARDEYIREIEVNPGAPGAHNNLGLVFRDQGELGKAVLAFDRALRLDPGLREAAINLSIVLERLDREEEAVSVLERALSSAPHSWSLRTALADLYERRGRPDLAERERARADSLERPFSPFRTQP